MTGRHVVTLLAASVLLLAGGVLPAHAWDDASDDLDLPWMGSGERARLFTKKSVCIMCPTGYRFQRSWGRSGRSGADPYSDVGAALRFLRKQGVLDAWPEAIGEGSVGDGEEIIDPRAAPYRFTIVMLEPMVVVMRFDLGALVKLGDVDPAQAVGTPYLNQGVEFGTRLPATGTLLWFSPQAGHAPSPVAMAGADRGAIVTMGVRLALERRGDTWHVAAPQRVTAPGRE